MVLSNIGKTAPKKVMNTMLTSLLGHNMMDMGTQAIAGIGRNISNAGMQIWRTHL